MPYLYFSDRWVSGSIFYASWPWECSYSPQIIFWPYLEPIFVMYYFWTWVSFLYAQSASLSCRNLLQKLVVCLKYFLQFLQESPGLFSVNQKVNSSPVQKLPSSTLQELELSSSMYLRPKLMWRLGQNSLQYPMELTSGLCNSELRQKAMPSLLFTRAQSCSSLRQLGFIDTNTYLFCSLFSLDMKFVSMKRYVLRLEGQTFMDRVYSIIFHFCYSLLQLASSPYYSLLSFIWILETTLPPGCKTAKGPASPLPQTKASEFKKAQKPRNRLPSGQASEQKIQRCGQRMSVGPEGLIDSELEADQDERQLMNISSTVMPIPSGVSLDREEDQPVWPMKMPLRQPTVRMGLPMSIIIILFIDKLYQYQYQSYPKQPRHSQKAFSAFLFCIRDNLWLCNDHLLRMTVLVSKQLWRPSSPSSRPIPESLQPPKGKVCWRTLQQLPQTVPLLSLLTNHCISSTFSVTTPAPSPYSELLALCRTSSLVSNLKMDITGPKISYFAIFMLSVTSAKRVGSMKKPFVPWRLPPVTRRAPYLTPASMQLITLSYCYLLTRGPWSVDGSSGLPTLIDFTASEDFFTNFQYKEEWTKVLEPATQH